MAAHAFFSFLTNTVSYVCGQVKMELWENFGP